MCIRGKECDGDSEVLPGAAGDIMGGDEKACQSPDCLCGSVGPPVSDEDGSAALHGAGDPYNIT